MSELTPYLAVKDARKAMEWYRDVLGAVVTYDPIVMEDGRVGHMQMAVDGAEWMMADESPEIGHQAPDPSRGATVTLHLTVEDVDALAQRVTAADVPMDRGPEDAEHIGRVAIFRDPFGHRWFLNQPVRGD